ncbi:hypothetical protein [Kitasatospora sp. NPDC093806]|uniref:hypothetical protein n=1 Tax=Kitasatospora sp. NPDC093806 TaxID=3155075 RepID=UPI003428DA83
MRLLPRSAALVGAAAAVAALVGPVPAATAITVPPRPPAGRYLNLHQCVFDSFRPASFDLMTTVVPSGDGRFTAGTNVSDTVDPDPVCGAGDGTYVPNVYRASQAYDLTAGRYLNLHQCVFFSPYSQTHLTTVVATTDRKFVAGTNVSDTRDTAPWCSDGGLVDPPIPLLSSALPLDLTAGRYLNLHQCMYYFLGRQDHFTTVAPSGDGRFRAGTNVSDTPDTKPACAPGDGQYNLIPLLSGVKALPIR